MFTVTVAYVLPVSGYAKEVGGEAEEDVGRTKDEGTNPWSRSVLMRLICEADDADDDDDDHHHHHHHHLA
jgi:hypothetical protein